MARLYPCIAVNQQGISIVAWQDERNDNKDIYGTANYPLIPLNLVAGSGFNGLVPLSWDNIYATPGVTVYNIYRSTTPGGPYTFLTTVNLNPA